MKQKLLLSILIILIFICTLAISVNAVSGAATDEFGTVTTVNGLTSVSTDTDALVVLKNADGTFSTYYTYYIYPKFNWRGGMSAPDFTGLNSALGTSYNNSSIIRIQLLSDCKYIELPSECNTNLKELYIPEDINTTTFYRTYFTVLEKVNIPSCITSISANTFDGTSTLKYVTFGESFSMTSLPNAMFSGCASIEEIRLPNSVTSIGMSFFNGCTSLKTIYLSENLVTSGKSMLVNVTNAKIYASSKWFSTSEPNSASFSYVGHAPSDITLFYVGTKAEAEALKAKSTHNGIKNATLVEYDPTKSDDYYVIPNQTAWTIVYGYSKCLAFYDGHNITDDTTLSFTDYTSEIFEMSGCSRNCGVNYVVNKYAPIFTFVGYSVKENDATALCAGYTVNHASMAVYKKYNTSVNLSYGIVASKPNADGSALLKSENGNVLAIKSTTVVANVDTSYAGYDFVLRGFNDGNKDTALVICSYVFDGTSIMYMTDACTATVPTAITFSEVLTKQGKEN